MYNLFRSIGAFIKKYINLFQISNIERIDFRKDINGLRAIAVISVVLYHAEIKFFSGGWLGVDIFFVTSGYLISNIIFSELNQNKFYFKNFYIRRLRRIVPALFSTILISIPISYILLTPKAIIEFAYSIIASIFFYANLYFQNLDFYNAEPAKFMPLLHIWSLGVEEQFYIIFPILCFLFFKFNKKYITFYITIIFLFSIYLNSTSSELVKFYQVQFRAWELLLGALIMIINQKFKFKNSGILGMIILIFSIYYFDDSMLTLNSIEPKIIANLAVSLILISEKNNYFFNFLNSKFFNFLGNISYSLYLLHQPIFVFYRLLLKKYDFQSKNFYIVFVILVLILISQLNFLIVEKKFQTTTLKKLTFFIFLSLTVSVIFVFFTFKSDGYKNRFNYIPEKVMFYSINTNLYPDEKDYSNFEQHCNSESKKTLYLIGDSHLNTFSYTLLKNHKDLACDFKINIIFNPTGRCLLSQQTDVVEEIVECTDQYFNKFISNLKDEQPLVLVIGRFDTWLKEEKGGKEIKCQNCNYIEVFSERIRAISNSSEKLIIVHPVPTYDFKIAESYLYKKQPWGVDITISYSSWQEYIEFTDNFFSKIKANNIINFYPEELFCDKLLDSCFASKNNELYYTDDNHLTVEGNELLIKKLKTILYNLNS